MVERQYENDILKERESIYGDPVDMHERIAMIWSGILDKHISAHDVALCMTGLKLARAKNDPSHTDSLIDAKGYAEIGQMIQKQHGMKEKRF